MYKETRTKYKKQPRPRIGQKNHKQKSRIDIHKLINDQLETQPLKPYVQLHSFGDFSLHGKLLQRISDSKYLIPTEIQDKSISHILNGSDLIGIAGTGTGKTAAFLIPIIQQLIERPVKNKALVIAPTRELASQILEEFRKLSRGLDLHATTLIGGVDVNRSIKALHKTNHVIIATPGRLIDMVDRRHVSLESFQILVLDEFDRMLDMGFLPDVKKIIDQMYNKEQTLLFSATMNSTQKGVIEWITNSPVKVTASTGRQLTHAIAQDVLYVPGDRTKAEVLHDLISENRDEKVLLFCDTKRMVNKVQKKLQSGNIRSDMIHGDKTQRARELALDRFRKGKVQVLVATDVVARGIDVLDVSLVINYEVPGNYNDYVHRIGRTGRAGKSGKAITLVG
jgi:ATP-dependent RNA helicase RhlE